MLENYINLQLQKYMYIIRLHHTSLGGLCCQIICSKFLTCLQSLRFPTISNKRFYRVLDTPILPYSFSKLMERDNAQSHELVHRVHSRDSYSTLFLLEQHTDTWVFLPQQFWHFKYAYVKWNHDIYRLFCWW